MTSVNYVELLKWRNFETKKCLFEITKQTAIGPGSGLSNEILRTFEIQGAVKLLEIKIKDENKFFASVRPQIFFLRIKCIAL